MDYTNMKIQIEECLHTKKRINADLENNFSFEVGFSESTGYIYGNIYHKKGAYLSELQCGQVKVGVIELAVIEVPEEMQGRKIGSQLFDILIRMIKIFNEHEDVLIDHKKIGEIAGILYPYEPPLDQYEKSIPFYQSRCEKYGLEFLLYEEDDMMDLSLVPKEMYEEFKLDKPEGCFRMVFNSAENDV